MTKTLARRCRWSGALALVLACGVAAAARAEVNIEGSAAAVRVLTSRNTVADVLSALGATFNVRYRTTAPLDAAAQATYSGSVEQVISRLLDGYNYVVKHNRDTIEIVVLGRGGNIAIPPPAAKSSPPRDGSSPPKDVVSRWR